MSDAHQPISDAELSVFCIFLTTASHFESSAVILLDFY
jgi:hypothetical protein